MDSKLQPVWIGSPNNVRLEGHASCFTHYLLHPHPTDILFHIILRTQMEYLTLIKKVRVVDKKRKSISIDWFYFE